MIDNDLLMALASIAWKPTLLLIIAWVIHLALGSRRSLIQATLGNAVVLGLLVLPLAMWVFPRLRCEVWPAETTSTSTPISMPNEPEIALDSSNEEIRIPMDFQPPPQPAIEPMNLESSAPIALEQPEINEPHNRLSFQIRAEQIILSVYGLVAFTLGLRLIMGCWVVAKLRRSSVFVTSPLWIERLQHWTATLEIARQPRLLVSDRVSSPMVLGWWKPCIVIPASMLNVKSLSMIDAILIHELAHIKRNDYAWNLALKTLQIVYWPHPLAWVYAKTLSTTREQVCDELCIHHLGGNTVYRTSLLNVAEMMLARPRTGLGLMMANGTKLGRRLKRIAQGEGDSRCLLGQGVRLAAMLVVLLFVGALGTLELARASMDDGALANSTVREPASSPTIMCEVVVKDQASGKPLVGAFVHAYYTPGVYEKFKTNEQGQVFLPLNKFDNSRAIIVGAWGDSHVYQRHTITVPHEAGVPRTPKPTLIGLWPGQTIGGQIVNEQGKPVADAEIRLSGSFEPSDIKAGEGSLSSDGLKTDQQGRWRFSRSRKIRYLLMNVFHKDYADASYSPHENGGPSTGNRPLNLDSFFKQTNVYVLKKGTPLSGGVLNSQGKPIANAFVHVGEFLPTIRKHYVWTNAEGRFTLYLSDSLRKPVYAVAQADGHSPAMIEISDLDQPEELEFRLKNRVLRGQVVDSQDRPVSGVYVQSAEWTNGVRSVRCVAFTDAEGRFTFPEAFSGSFTIRAYKFGWVGLNDRQINPQDQDIKLVLNQSHIATIALRDQKTKDSIFFDQVVAEHGTIDPKTGQEQWLRIAYPQVNQGALTWRTRPQKQTYRLRIHVPGYEPYTTEPISDAQDQVKRMAFLQPLQSTKRVQILNIDNVPIANVEVSLATPNLAVFLGSGQIQSETSKKGRPLVFISDSQGFCTLPLLKEPFKAAIAHDQGFALVSGEDLAKMTTIQLVPWGRVEGSLMLGKAVGVNDAILLRADQPNAPWFRKAVDCISSDGQKSRMSISLVPMIHYKDYETTVNSKGQFVFDRVLPIDMLAYHQVKSPVAALTLPLHTTVNHTQLFKVAPAQNTVINITRRGRPVVGRLVLPNSVDLKNHIYLVSLMPETLSAYPSPQGETVSEQEAMFERWWNSPEGKALRQKRVEPFFQRVAPDGSFRIEEVVPGDYKFGFGRINERIATERSQTITVTSFDGAWSDEPLDVGELKVK